MKLLLFCAATLLVASCVLADDVATQKKCEDFLPADTCNQLRVIAQKFNEKAGAVNKAITDAFNKHKTKAGEVLSYVKEYLVANAKNFSCVSVLSTQQCQQLKDFAKLMHAKAGEASIAVREAIVNGAKNSKVQFQKAMEFLKNDVSCEKILGLEQCEKLLESAKTLKENIKTVHQALVAALQKHLSKTKDILKSVRETLVEKAKNFNCTDVLTLEQCNRIKNIGQRLKLKSSEVQKAVKEAIANGAEKAKQIFSNAMDFLLIDARNMTCEDLIKAETCQKIKDFAKKVHARASDVALAVREAIVQGAQSTQDTLKKAIEFLKAEISCKDVFSIDTCDKIRKLADSFHVSLKTVNEAMREAIANGVTKVSDLYKAAVKYITEKWGGIFGDEPQIEKRSVDEKLTNIGELLKQKITKMAMDLLDMLKVTNEKIRENVKELIENGKIKITNIKEKVNDLLALVNSNDEDTMNDVNMIYKRSTKDSLVDLLKSIKGKSQEFIEKLLKLSKDKLEQIKEWIKQLKQTDDSIPSDEMEDDLDLVHDVLKDGVNMAFADIVEDAIKNIE